MIGSKSRQDDSPDHPGPTLYFDGVCNLCNSLVAFVIRHNAAKNIRFVSLQSDLGKRTLHEAGLDAQKLTTILFRDQNRLSVKSSAVLGLLKHLDKPWSYGSILMIIPRPIRDWVYSFVAARRYRWFGRRDSCIVPTPELQSRFLSD